MSAVVELKNTILEMMESAFQNSDINPTQQMGVSMSNTIREKGVVIIQNQSIEVYSRIFLKMVRVLKLCDSIETPRLELLPPLIAEEVIVSDDPIDECCKWLFENNINWDAMQDLMKARYLEYVVSQFKTKTEAAKMLDVGSTYLCKLTKPKSKRGV